MLVGARTAAFADNGMMKPVMEEAVAKTVYSADSPAAEKEGKFRLERQEHKP